jgi:hypothetical protein
MVAHRSVFTFIEWPILGFFPRTKREISIRNFPLGVVPSKYPAIIGLAPRGGRGKVFGKSAEAAPGGVVSIVNIILFPSCNVLIEKECTLLPR